MSGDETSSARRRFLTQATTAIGAVGTGFLLVPFISSMAPSAKARAAGAPVRADISKLAPGQMIRVEWRGKPVWIVKRTPEVLETLSGMGALLADEGSEASKQPDYTKNAARSLKPEILVLVGICTHLGCSPTYRPDVAPIDLGPEWQGGFFCPCHGSKFDMAGRVFKGMPAPTNLPVPPYRFLSDVEIVIGEDQEVA